MELWIVRSHGGAYIEQFLSHSIIALNWCPDDNLTGKNIKEIKHVLNKCYPGKESSVPMWAGMINNFINNMKVGDYVLTYDPSTRIYYTGKIESNYKYNKNIDECHHTRKVQWEDNWQISRDSLSNDTKNALGSFLTVFQLKKEQEKEILNIINKNQFPQKDSNEVKEENIENSRLLAENAKETLKDAIQGLDPEEMEELFKEILNAMGYIAQRTPKGADRGIDIFASKDGLGLEDPRIFVEVKHRKGKMGAQDIRTFMGGRQPSDRCLYVSTGGFAKEAKYEAERSTIPLKLIDIDDLANLLSLHYDKFSAEGKILLPLKKVYLPLN